MCCPLVERLVVTVYGTRESTGARRRGRPHSRAPSSTPDQTNNPTLHFTTAASCVVSESNRRATPPLAVLRLPLPRMLTLDSLIPLDEAMSSSNSLVTAKAKACADRRTTKPAVFNVAHAASKWQRRALQMPVQILSADGGRLSVTVRKSGQIRDLRAAAACHPDVLSSVSLPHCRPRLISH